MTREKRKKLIRALTGVIYGINSMELTNPAVDIPLIGKILEKGDFFDADYYLERNPDVAAEKIDPACHYAEFGFHEGRPPSALMEKAVSLIPPDKTRECKSLQRFLELVLGRLLATAEPDGSVVATRILRQGSYEAWYDMPLHVQWSITDMCNYRCSYCNFQQRRKTFDRDRFHSFEKMRNAVDNLVALNRPAYEIVLLGGEPTVYPHLLDLIDYLGEGLEERLRQFIIVTNGSQSVDYYNRLARMASKVYTQLMLSIHLETASPAHLYELVRELDPAIEINFLLMLHPEKLGLADEIFEGLCALRKDKLFNLTLQIIYGPPDYTRPDERYAPDFEDWQNSRQQKFRKIAVESGFLPEDTREPFFHSFWEIEENGLSEMRAGGVRSVNFQDGWLKFKNMYCLAGVNLVYIDENGVVNGLSCGHSQGKINIFDKDSLRNLEFMDIVRCPSPACICSESDGIMKFADKNEAENFMRIAKAKQERLFRLKS